MRLSLFTVISGLSLLLLVIAFPQKASATGKFNGEWKGKIYCGDVRDHSNENAQPQVENGTPLTVKISNNGHISNFVWDGGENINSTVFGTIENGGRFTSTIDYKK